MELILILWRWETWRHLLMKALKFGKPTALPFVGTGPFAFLCSAGILEQSMGVRNWVGVGMLFRPAHKLAEYIPWNRFLGSLKVWKYRLWITLSQWSFSNFQENHTESKIVFKQKRAIYSDLKGQCHKVFLLQIFSWIIFPNRSVASAQEDDDVKVTMRRHHISCLGDGKDGDDVFRPGTVTTRKMKASSSDWE